MKLQVVRQALLLIGLAFLPALAQALYHRGQPGWQQAPLREGEVRLKDARAWGDAVLWVDARPSDEFEREHIPGAVSLNEDRWPELLPLVLTNWSPDKRIVIYCSTQSCELSHAVAKRLREEAGLQNVYVLHGGWEAWHGNNQHDHAHHE